MKNSRDDRNALGSFHERLTMLIDSFVNKVYDVTMHYPREEVFGVVSQVRRSALSIALNYVEGYARRRKNVMKNFLEISYGSLKESVYLSDFSLKRGYISEVEHKELSKLSDEIGRMLWGTLSKI